ncbi:MAG: sulfite exporter TauE/SafE family protein [Myxococcales bacterium]|nr:sulfite exporter TauE/SafE family protein [Myxococcales bacterium]
MNYRLDESNHPPQIQGMETLLLLLGMGIFAGALTTLSGIGGGMLLLLVLSLVWSPAEALACTAPALLLGNLHRLFLFRRSVAWSTIAGFAAAAVPGSVVGGLLVSAAPPALTRWLLVSMTLLAIARALGWIQLRPRAWAMVPAGGLIGALNGAVGGAGLLVAPLLLTVGLSGEAYVASVSACAVAMHLGRIIGYGAGGLFTSHLAQLSLVTAAAILGGNFIGRRLRTLSSRIKGNRLEYATLVACVGLALLGIGH